jgi:uncharacterized phage infection (PIP) family protein YhgE
MKVDEIAPIAAPSPGGPFDQHSHRTHQTTPSGDSDSNKTAETDAAAIKPPSQERIQLNRLEAKNAKTQQIAQQIRQTNQTIDTIDSHLSEMRAKLEQIVKIYPPYPPDSVERIEALRQFSALRQMIDQVIRSTEGGDIPRSLFASGSRPEAAGMETPNGNIELSAGPRHRHPAQSDLDIPDISTNATDEQITGALERTVAAQATLQSRRQLLLR